MDVAFVTSRGRAAMFDRRRQRARARVSFSAIARRPRRLTREFAARSINRVSDRYQAARYTLSLSLSVCLSLPITSAVLCLDLDYSRYL
jgi:hypothetical protein